MTAHLEPEPEGDFVLSRLLTFLFAALVPHSGNALEPAYRCTFGTAVREISVERAQPADPLPCSVRYRKPSEGVADSVPYRADTNANFCAEKADALRRTLERGGWTCERLDADGGAARVGVTNRVRAAIADSETFEFWAAELGRAELIEALVVEEVSDLNGDGSPEYLARVDHPKVQGKPLWAGSELLAGDGEGFRHLFSGVLEIRVLSSQTGGYRDIAVRALPVEQSQLYWLAKYTRRGYRTVEIHQHKLGEHPETRVERLWDDVAGGFTESETLEGASELVKQF